MLTYQKLKITLAQAQTPEDKIQAYLTIVRYLLHRNHKEAELYIEKALDLAEAEQMDIPKAFICLNKLIVSVILGQTKDIIVNLPTLYAHLQKIEHKNLGAYYYLMGVLTNFTISVLNLSRANEKGIWYYLKSLEYFEQYPNKLQQINWIVDFKPVLFKGLSYAYLFNENLKQAAFSLHLTTHFVEQKQNNVEDKADLYYGWAIYYWKIKSFDLCVEYALKSVNLTTPKNEYDFEYMKNAQNYTMIGVVYLEGYKIYPKALEYFKKGLKIAEFFDFKIALYELYTRIGQTYKAMNDFEQAYHWTHLSSVAYKTYAFAQSSDYINSIGHIISQKEQAHALLQVFFQQQPHTQPPNLETVYYYEEIAKLCFKADLHIGDLAVLFNISRQTLNRKIQALFGQSTQKFINAVRMLKAYDMIISTSLTISEIARTVGFEHLSHFGVSFKKKFGLLPRELKMAQKC